MSTALFSARDKVQQTKIIYQVKKQQNTEDIIILNTNDIHKFREACNNSYIFSFNLID